MTASLYFSVLLPNLLLPQAITTLGNIFNVPTVASKLIDEMKNDFKVAQRTLATSAGHSLTAVGPYKPHPNPSPNPDLNPKRNRIPNPEARPSLASLTLIRALNWPGVARLRLVLRKQDCVPRGVGALQRGARTLDPLHSAAPSHFKTYKGSQNTRIIYQV